MRYATVRTIPREGRAFHPLGEALAAEPAVQREKIHRAEILDEDTCILLGEDSGNVERYRAIVEQSAHVRDYNITEANGWWYSYLVFEPTEVIHQLMATRYETELMIEMPIDIRDDGSMVSRIVGPQDAFAELTAENGDAFDVELIETGEFHPDVGDIYRALTQRQREVLDAAMALGYYRNPREATHDEIANEVGISPGTVGEHLRKIESRVFSQLTR